MAFTDTFNAFKRTIQQLSEKKIEGGLQGGVQRIKNTPITEFFLPTSKTAQRSLANTGRTLQRFPSITVNPPAPRQTRVGPITLSEAPPFKATRKVVPFAFNLPGDIIRSFGKTFERIAEEKGRKEIKQGFKDLPGQLKRKEFLAALENPAVQTTLDLSDFAPGGLVFSLGTKAILKESAEKALREGGEQIAKQSTKQLARQSGKEASRMLLDDAIRFTDDLSKQISREGRSFTARVFEVNKVKFNPFDLKNATKETIDAAKAEIKQGIFRPIVVADDGGVLDGTHRLLAARELGIKEWPGALITEGGKVPVSLGKEAARKTGLSPEASSLVQSRAPETLEAGKGAVLGFADKPSGGSIPPTKKTGKYAFNINKERLGLKGKAAQKLDSVAEEMKPILQGNKGKPLTNKEVIEGSRKASMLSDVLTRKEAAEFSEKLTASRNFLKEQAEATGITPEFINQIEVVSSRAADAGRKLRAFSIDAQDVGIKAKMIKELKDLGVETDRILKAAKGVDWNDAGQVAKFYRQFKPAKFLERLEEYRYVNMLSSPNTFVVNLFSNFLQTGFVAPIEKTIAGGLDFARAKLTRSEQKYFVSQGVDYAKGYWKNLPEAWASAKSVLIGKGGLLRPDIDFIPTSTSKLHKLYTTPLRALEAGDQFFITMTEAGELASLKRAGITGEVAAKKAKDTAQFRLFRQKFDPEGVLGQNKVLQVFDKWNSAVNNLRHQPGGKWIVPFLQTPINILKQGIEFSPAGILTVPGSKEPMVQLARTAIGSTVFAGAYAIADAGLATWDTPTNKDDKAEFFEAGLQPYSIKVGNKWVSYSKLGPLSYPFAMAAALKWAEDNGAKNKGLKVAGQAMLGSLQFFADQSYVRGFGDILDAIEGDEFKRQRAITNIPSQLIPMRSLQGWIARLVDPIYREAGNSAQSILSQVPFASKSLQPYLTPEGQPSERQFPLINAFSPLKATGQRQTRTTGTAATPDVVKFFGTTGSKNKGERTFELLKSLPREEANRRLDELEETSPRLYASFEKAARLETMNADEEERRISKISSVAGRTSEVIKALNKLETKEEKNELLNRWEELRIITDSVTEELFEAKKAGKI